ncbi:MAG: hypothetical protein KAS38_13605, partial [Anaerolineales bacterium]|nr:hypothetical protein [Anaerolineales bacterium]
RYAHGVYLGGYTLALFAVSWTLFAPGALLWTLGLWIVIATGSALLVHFNLHRTWDDLISAIFGTSGGRLSDLLRGIFVWAAAWSFPVWCVLLLDQFSVPDGYQWLGFSLPALTYIGLALWLRRVERTYAWSFQTAGQFYIIASLLVSAPSTAHFLTGNIRFLEGTMDINAVISVQTLAVAFYALWASIYHRSIFTHLAAWLSFFPYTLAWVAYSSLSSVQFALPWIGWATVLIIMGYILDPRRVRYAHGPYLAGYLLAIFSLFWSVPDRLTNLYVLGATVLLALVSHLVVHSGRHYSFDDFVGFIWRKPGSVANRAARTAFLFFAAYAFPIWLVLMLSYHQVPWAWRGLALALVAPIYIAFGLAVHSVKGEYTWPLYSAGYALTAIGAMVAFEDLALAIYVLALDTVVYAVSAYIFRQPFWLYLANTLVSVVLILTLNYNQRLTATWVSQSFMALAFLYFALGLWLDGRFRTARRAGNVASFALPFYSLGYLLSAVSLAAASGERTLAIGVYSAGVVLYALSAWAFRDTIFIYPAAWLAGIPYYLGMTLFISQERWYGLGWLPLILAYILIGRFTFRERLKLRPLRAALANPSMPFYLLAYALSVSMIALSAADALALTLAFSAAAGIYLLSTALFRYPAWLYPSLLAAHLALLSFFAIQPSGKPASYISLPFLGLTWVIALIGYAVSLRSPASRNAIDGKLFFELGGRRLDIGHVPSVGYLLTFSWAQPFFLFVTLDIVLWGGVALFNFDTALIVSVGYAVLLGLFAMLWKDRALAYGSLACTLLAVCVRLLGAGLPLPILMAWLGGIGLGTYLIGKLIEQTIEAIKPKSSHLVVWPRPLRNFSVLLATLAILGTLPFAIPYTTACAAALAFAGALYLAFAYQNQRYWLGYLGTGMLLIAWVMVLVMQDVRQPQLYAIPFGLYLAGIGYLERRQGRVMFGNVVECLGFSVMLLTSFVQSLGGAGGFPYFLLLMAESLAIFWWGAAQHCKIPLFIGIGGSVTNILAQVVVLVNVYQVSRWFVTLGVGLVLVVIGVIVERKRERILSRAKEWQEALVAWD